MGQGYWMGKQLHKDVCKATGHVLDRPKGEGAEEEGTSGHRHDSLKINLDLLLNIIFIFFRLVSLMKIWLS